MWGNASHKASDLMNWWDFPPHSAASGLQNSLHVGSKDKVVSNLSSHSEKTLCNTFDERIWSCIWLHSRIKFILEHWKVNFQDIHSGQSYPFNTAHCWRGCESQFASLYVDFPGCSVVKNVCQCRSHRFGPWVGKISWRRKWQSIPAFSPGKSQGQRSLPGCSPWGLKSWTQLSN